LAAAADAAKSAISARLANLRATLSMRSTSSRPSPMADFSSTV
jgi:hypothetical protein